MDARRVLMAVMAAAVAMSAFTVSAPVRAATNATVVLIATSTTIPQGRPFHFTAAIQNHESQAAHVDVTFVLRGPSEEIPFDRWDGSVPGSGVTTKTLSVATSQWFSPRGEFSVAAESAGQDLGTPLTFTVTKPTQIAPIFKDVTDQAGLGGVTIPARSCGNDAAGAAWADVNGDGNLDLYVPSRSGPSHLFMNDGTGHFIDQAAARGVANDGSSAAGASFADYDNDGDPDLYVAANGINRLYQNDGSGHFVDVAAHAGVADGGDGSSASWGDYDNDGNVDLYVANYADCAGGVQPVDYDYDKLFHNNGDGTFTDVTSLLDKDLGTGVDGSTLGAGFQAAWFDYNNDGRQDLYLANDYFGKSPDKNHLWLNSGPAGDGTWSFQDVSVASGTGYSMNAMGIAVGDYNRDGYLDLALPNIESNRLLKNNHDGTFSDVAADAGVGRPSQKVEQRSITWAGTFADFNLDGWEDLYFSAGSIAPIEPQPNELFVNDHNGKFLDLSATSRADDAGVTRGAAFADYNGDGRMDIYELDLGGTPHLLENVTPKGGMHWLEVDTVGRKSNRDGCGARITTRIGGRPLTREVFCGSESLSSGNDPTVHIGLGSATNVSKLTIKWPSGKRQVLHDVKADRRMIVTEPK